MRSFSVGRWAGLLAVLVLLGGCGPSPTPAPGAAGATSRPVAEPASTGAPAATQPERLRVPYVAISVTQLPAWVAQDAGLFAKQGLDVSLEYIPTGSTLTQMLVAGEADFGVAGSEAPIAASLGGAELVILAPTTDRLLFKVYARPDVAAAGDMRGRRLGITRIGSSTEFAGRLWIESLALPADSTPALVQAGGQPEILAAIQSGAVDAGVLSPPADVQARRLGLVELADLGQQAVPFYQSSVLATRRVIDEQPDLVRRFMRAIVEANAVIHQEPAAAKRALAQYTKSTDDEIIEASYRAAVPAIPRVPLPQQAAIESALGLVARTNPAAQGADPGRFYDPRFVQELEASGFIESLYR